jgi:hypothetical protein
MSDVVPVLMLLATRRPLASIQSTMLLRTMDPMRVDEDGSDLLRQLDEIITQAEEKDLMQHYDQVLSKRETWESRGQGKVCRLPWSASDDPNKVIQEAWKESSDGEETKLILRGKSNVRQEELPIVSTTTKRPRLHLHPPSEEQHSLEVWIDVIRSTILLPRCISSLVTSNHSTGDRNEEEETKEPTKPEIIQYFSTQFQNHCAALELFPLIDWTLFQIDLQSANPTSWRFIVTGYRAVVDAFLRFIEQQLLLEPPP